ncbi:MAG: protein-glutamate O-methyltransferase CheR [Clostridia bacterium]|nr:protein-glutamate O-methyltransferase CheR [Clostridia bacterium]
MDIISDKEFELLAELIENYSGIHLKLEKKTLMTGRLNVFLRELNLNSFMDFYNYVKNDKEGIYLSKLIDRMTTNHTFFMREKQHFDFFRDSVLPYLKSTVKDRDLRIWCAASSSGEEPYTLAMILEDAFGKEIPSWDKKLLATDISFDVLEQAKLGIYPKDRLVDIPKMWMMNYFKDIGNGSYQVIHSLRNQVIYRRLNLTDPTFPFKKKLHVIFCRNVMIYFDNPTKEKLINQFYEILVPGGYLFVGHSESIDRNKSKFKYIQPAVYRKT